MFGVRSIFTSAMVALYYICDLISRQFAIVGWFGFYIWTEKMQVSGGLTVSGKQSKYAWGTTEYDSFVSFLWTAIGTLLAVLAGPAILDAALQAYSTRKDPESRPNCGGGCCCLRASPLAALTSALSCLPLSTNRRDLDRLFYTSVATTVFFGAWGMSYMSDPDYQLQELDCRPYAGPYTSSSSGHCYGYGGGPFSGGGRHLMVKADGTHRFLSIAAWCSLIFVPMAIKIVLYYTVISKIEKSADAMPFNGHGMSFFKVGRASALLSETADTTMNAAYLEVDAQK